MTDQLTFEKIWYDDYSLEIEVKGKNEYISAKQNCYITDDILVSVGEEILNFLRNNKNNQIYKFGKIGRMYTPAFTMNIIKSDNLGHFEVEMNMEITDDEKRNHRCMFFVKSEYGMIENFAMSLIKMSKSETNKVILNN